MLCFFFITFLIRSLFCNRRGCCMHATTVIIYCLLPVHHSQMRQYNYTIFRQTTPWAPGLYTATRFKKSLLFHVVRISTTLILRVNDIYMLTTLSTWISVHMCITYICLTHHILDCNNQLNPILRREETKVECVWQHSYLTCTWLSDNPMCTCNAEQQHWCLVHIPYLRSCSHLSINNLKTNNGIWFLPYRLKRNQMVLKAVFHDSDQEDLHTKSQQCHRVIATLVQYCRSILPCFVMWLLCCLFSRENARASSGWLRDWKFCHTSDSCGVCCQNAPPSVHSGLHISENVCHKWHSLIGVYPSVLSARTGVFELLVALAAIVGTLSCVSALMNGKSRGRRQYLVKISASTILFLPTLLRFLSTGDWRRQLDVWRHRMTLFWRR